MHQNVVGDLHSLACTMSQAWIAEMSSYLKAQDPKHMVTVGEEGFWGPGAKREHANPGNGWASLTGQNFTANMNLPTIDFAAVHLWPDNWEVGHPEHPCLFAASHYQIL